MSGELTTSVHDSWTALTRLLRAATWPYVVDGSLTLDPVDDEVAVYFGDPDQAQPDENGNAPHAIERVVVVSEIESPEIEWGPVGRLADDERYRISVNVSSFLPGRTSAQASARLKQLVDVVFGVVRAVNAARPSTSPAEFAHYPANWAWHVSQARPRIPPTSVGYVGICEISVDCQFRVGVPPIP